MSTQQHSQMNNTAGNIKLTCQHIQLIACFKLNILKQIDGRNTTEHKTVVNIGVTWANFQPQA